MVLDLIALLACLVLVAKAKVALDGRRSLPEPGATAEGATVSLVVSLKAADPDPDPGQFVARLVQSGDVFEAIGVLPPGRTSEGDRAGAAPFARLVTADPVSPGTRIRPALLARGAREATGEWLLFTEPGVEIRPGTVRRAVALAGASQAPIATLFPSPRFRGWFAEALFPVVCQWTGDGVPAPELERPEAKVAAGSPSFFLVRRDAYERIGGHGAVPSAPRDASALVRNAKRAGLRVASAPGGEDVVRPALPAGEMLREALDRFHEVLPRWRGGALILTAFLLLAGVRPFWRAVEEIVPGGIDHGSLGTGLTLAACAVLLVHRVFYHRLMGIRLRGIVFHPFAALGMGSLATVALVQRLFGRGPAFERLPAEAIPDHSAGVDYAKVYTERYFDGVDSSFSPWGLRDEARYYERILEPVVKHVPEGRALDVGCGYGFLTRRLSQHYEVEGIDVSEAAIQRCRESMPDVCFTRANVEESFPQPDGSFDLVTLTDVLEHIVHPERLIENARRVLKDGGILYLTTPNLNWMRRALYARADRKEHHVSLRSRAEVVRLLAEKGFEVIESWTYPSGLIPAWRFRSNLGPEMAVLATKKTRGA